MTQFMSLPRIILSNLRLVLPLCFGVIILVLLPGCSGLAGNPEIVATIPIGTANDNPVAMQSTVVTGPTPTSLASFGMSAEDLVTPETTGSDLGYPSESPDLTRGAAIYAQNCTACHGDLGAGDGPLVIDGQVPAPHSFQDEDYVRQINPKEWFRTITNGKIENLMPPWKDALTEQERWDVALYTYTLHYMADQLEIGEILYADCAECHGETGNGDGPEANKNPQRPAAELTNLKSLNDLSDANMFVMVNEGQADLMPAYGDEFSDEEIRAVVAYARTLGLTNTDPITADDADAQVPTAESTEAAAAPGSTSVPDRGGSSTGSGGIVPPPRLPTIDPSGSSDGNAQGAADLTISGTVANQTDGGTVPEDLTVTLRAYSAADLTSLDEMTQTTTLNDDGTYQFTDVSYREDLVYLTTVTYLDRDFASGLYQPDPAAPTLDMPIVIYELTDDPSVVTINASVTQIQVGGDTLEATYSVRFTNTSDRLFTALEPEADGRYRSMHITLPPGALVVGITDQPRYIYDEEANIVYDTTPLQPGEERFIQVTYLLDYSSGAVIEYTTPYRIDGQLRVLLENPSVTLEGELFPSQGEEQLGEATFQGYGERATLDAGTTIQYTLTGEGGEAAILPEEFSSQSSASNMPNASSAVVTSDMLVPLLAILGVGVVIIGGGYMLVRRTANGANAAGKLNKQRLIDGLVRQIAELDAQHDAGQINHDVYRQRREQLKGRLAELMDETANAS
jgi:mono/diheme cytochrome c family protein